MSAMARSLFNARSVTKRSTDFEEDDWPRLRPTEVRRRRKLPWIFRFVGYHLAAAFGIVVAFIGWLLVGALMH
jgi:hypothetical protein